MEFLTIESLDIQNKRVLVRVDFNVPQDDHGNITDDLRIRQSLPTIEYIIRKGGSCILLSHLGQPNGEINEKFSLAPVAKKLSELLNHHVTFASDSIGSTVRKLVLSMAPGDIILLENLRFHPGETDPTDHPEFARALAELGQLYVNDAFATCHRKHASTYTITSYFPNSSAAGFLVQKEVAVLTNLLHQATHPIYVVIGGKKVSTKLGVLNSLLKKINGLFIGGAMAYTFAKAKGYDVGDSPIDEEYLDEALRIIKQCKREKIDLWLPSDLVIANEFSNESQTQTISLVDGVPKGWFGMDIGPKTIETWSMALSQAATIFWNGPMGVFEFTKFSKGTKAMAYAIAESKSTSIIGGGDSAAAINQFDLSNRMTFISTGGGATLEFIEDETLPGLECLTPSPSLNP